MIGSFDYIKAKSWHEAAKILDTYGSKASVLAGGTDLLPAMKLKLHRPEILVDLSGIPETKGIGESGTNDSKITSLSPLMTLSQLCNDSFILETYPALALAASKVGSPQLRNMGTLGGNICLDTRCLYYNQSEQWRRTRPPCFKIDGNVCHVQRRGKICLAEFQADTVPILIALNADLKIVSIKGERIIPLDQFYSDTGHPSNLLGPSELIEEIRLPLLTKGCRATYERFAVRAGIDFAIVSVAIFLNINQDTHRCQEARIVVSGALPSPFICRKVSAVLQDQKLQDEFIKMTAEEAAREAKPINPTGFSVSYKRHLIEALTRKGLQNLLDIRTG